MYNVKWAGNRVPWNGTSASPSAYPNGFCIAVDWLCYSQKILDYNFLQLTWNCVSSQHQVTFLLPDCNRETKSNFFSSFCTNIYSLENPLPLPGSKSFFWRLFRLLIMLHSLRFIIPWYNLHSFYLHDISIFSYKVKLKSKRQF